MWCECLRFGTAIIISDYTWLEFFVCLQLFFVLNAKNASAMKRRPSKSTHSTRCWSIHHWVLSIDIVRDCKQHWKCDLSLFLCCFGRNSTDSLRTRTDQLYADRPVFNSYWISTVWVIETIPILLLRILHLGCGKVGRLSKSTKAVQHTSVLLESQDCCNQHCCIQGLHLIVQLHHLVLVVLCPLSLVSLHS